MGTIGILLVLYNDKNHILNLIKSIKEQVFTDFKVFAIETSNSGESIKMLKELFPNAICFPYLGNLGYAAGNNLLSKMASEYSIKFFLICNTDVILSPNTLGTLINIIKTDKTIAFASPIILKGSPIEFIGIQNYRLEANFKTGKIRNIDNGISEFNNLCETARVNTFAGCCFMIKSNAFFKSGQFNEDNFMYNEEFDLSYRLFCNGYYGIVTRNTLVWHNHGNDSSVYLQNLCREYYYINRNKILFFYRYKKYNSLLCLMLNHFIMLPVKTIWCLRKGGLKFWFFYYHGVLSGLFGIKGQSKNKF